MIETAFLYILYPPNLQQNRCMQAHRRIDACRCMHAPKHSYRYLTAHESRVTKSSLIEMPVIVRKLFSRAAVEVVTKPFLVEDELSTLAQECSEDWISSLEAEYLKGATPVSLEILNGGRFYYAKSAWDRLHPDAACRLLQLRARRGHASDASYGGDANNDKNLEPGMELYQSPGSDWCVRIWQIPDDLFLSGPVLVGDTIATGTTLVGTLGWLVSKMDSLGAFQDIHVMTIVGASEWTLGDGGVVEKLRHVEETLGKAGKTITVTFCNATFALDANGTDLNPSPALGAEWLPEALRLAEAQLGGFDARRLKCGVWDWGDRFTKPLRHLEEVLEHFGSMGDAPPYILEGLRERIGARKAAESE